MKRASIIAILIVLIMVAIFGTLGRRSVEHTEPMVATPQVSLADQVQPPVVGHADAPGGEIEEAGATATYPLAGGPTADSSTVSLEGQKAAGDVPERDWVRIPGTGVAIWPKP